MSCYLCLRPVVEPKLSTSPLNEAFVRAAGAPALCAGCRLELGRSFDADDARVYTRPADRRLPS